MNAATISTCETRLPARVNFTAWAARAAGNYRCWRQDRKLAARPGRLMLYAPFAGGRGLYVRLEPESDGTYTATAGRYEDGFEGAMHEAYFEPLQTVPVDTFGRAIAAAIDVLGFTFLNRNWGKFAYRGKTS